MPRVRFTQHLKRFFPTLDELMLGAGTLAEVIAELDRHHPGIAGYLIDESGTIRKHVNIFVGKELLRDRIAPGDAVEEADDIFIMQALSRR